MDRRQVLKVLTGSIVTAAAWPLLGSSRAFAAPASRPRFYLQIVPHGGMDAVFTTDPKKRAEVDKDIDVPFGSNDITEAVELRLGPGLRALARWVTIELVGTIACA